MLLTTPAFRNGDSIPRKFTCEGGNINPEFLIGNLPQGTKSMAFLIDDPDAPGGTFVHWIMWNIAPSVTLIKEESKPPGSVEGTNSAAKIGYTGPCPPPGKPHRYFFRVYALDANLNLIPGARREEFEAALEGHVLAKAEAMGIYERK